MKNSIFERLLRWFSQAFSSLDIVSIKRIIAFMIVVVVLTVWVLAGVRVIEVGIWKEIKGFGEILFAGALAVLGVNALLDREKIKAGISTSEEIPCPDEKKDPPGEETGEIKVENRPL